MRSVTLRLTYVNMTDLNTHAPTRFLRDEELRRGIELFYFAYRDFTRDPDEILAKYGYGRAHHRVIHFIKRNPGMPVSELLKYLRTTKQSLSRVLGQLVEEGYVVQEKGTRDRRQRLLNLTEKGQKLEAELSAPLRERVARAYKLSGAEAVAGYWKVLLNMVDEHERQMVLEHVERD